MIGVVQVPAQSDLSDVGLTHDALTLARNIHAQIGVEISSGMEVGARVPELVSTHGVKPLTLDLLSRGEISHDGVLAVWIVRGFQLANGPVGPEVSQALIQQSAVGGNFGDLTEVARMCAERELDLQILCSTEPLLQCVVRRKGVLLSDPSVFNHLNQFKHELHGAPAVSYDFKKPGFYLLSEGAGGVDVARTQPLGSVSDAERFLSLQYAAGFRGHVYIQGRLPFNGAEALPIIAEYLATDRGLSLRSKKSVEDILTLLHR